VSTLNDPDGRHVHPVRILELREGKIARLIEYFVDPFGAPQWHNELLTEQQ
jgi:hypothetical protein